MTTSKFKQAKEAPASQPASHEPKKQEETQQSPLDVRPLVAAAEGGQGMRPSALTSEDILALQGLIGNQAVQRLLDDPAAPSTSQASLQREGGVETAPLGGGDYLVVEGDSLWSIAERTYMDGIYWRQIYEANSHLIGDGGNLLYIGTRLSLPTIDVPVASVAQPDEYFTPMQEQSTLPDEEGAMSSQPSTEAQSDTAPYQDPSTMMSEPGVPNGTAPAVQFQYPDMKYPLEHSAVVPTPGGLLTFKLSGSITLKNIAPQSVMEFNLQNYELQAQQQVSAYTASFKVDPTGAYEVGVSSSVSGDLGTTKLELVPPATLKGSFEPKQTGKFNLGNNWEAEAKVGYEISFTAKPPEPEPVPEPRPWYERAWDWTKDHAGEIVVVGGVVVLVGITWATPIPGDEALATSMAVGMLASGS